MYEIHGEPIGYGGSSIIYNCRRILTDGTGSGILYTLKECYPSSSASGETYIRNELGEVVPSVGTDEAAAIFRKVRDDFLNEAKISQNIYETASRMVPILETSSEETIIIPEQSAVQSVNSGIGSEGQSADPPGGPFLHQPEKTSFEAGIQFTMQFP